MSKNLQRIKGQELFEKIKNEVINSFDEWNFLDCSDHSGVHNKSKLITAGLEFEQKEQHEAFNKFFREKLERYAEKYIIDFSGYIFDDMNWIVYDFDFSDDSKVIFFYELTLNSACFENATFKFPVIFSEIKFKQSVNFSCSHFLYRISFNNTIFNDSANFKRSKFYDSLSFNGMYNMNTAIQEQIKFYGDVDFTDVVFSGAVMFQKSIFYKKALFSNSNFKNKSTFMKSKFYDDINFSMSEFNFIAIFDHAYSKKIPNFRETKLQQSISMFDFVIEKPNKKQIQQNYSHSYYYDASLEECCRILKKIADDAKDNERKQMFFAYEMMAKRKNLSWTDKTCGELFINQAYEKCSNFGRSFMRPFWCLAIAWLVFALIYTLPAMIYHCMCNDKCAFWIYFSKSLKLSGTYIIPLFFSNDSNQGIEWFLFGNSGISDWLWGVYGFEAFLGLVFTFLIVLGLRNKYLNK